VVTSFNQFFVFLEDSNENTDLIERLLAKKFVEEFIIIYGGKK
jgi:hypothetical protein